MRAGSVYYITRARALAGKLPSRQELNYMAQTSEEGAFLERLQKRLGLQLAAQDMVQYFREFMGRVARDMLKAGEAGRAFFDAVLLENAKLALLSKVSGSPSFYYTAYGSAIGEEAVRRLLAAEDVQRARLGNEEIERHVRYAHALYQSFGSPELILHYFEGAQIRRIRKASRAAGATFEAMAFDVSVCSFVEPFSQDAAKALYVFGKPRCSGFADGLELLKRLTGIQTEERDPVKAMDELRRAVHRSALSEFSENNIVDLYFMMKLSEKDIERIKKYYSSGEERLLA